MLTLSSQILTCACFRTKLMKKLKRNLTKKRILVGDRKFSRRLQLIKKTRTDWLIIETFCKRETGNSSAMKLTNVPAPNHLTCVFTICNVLSNTNERKVEAN